MPLIGVCVAALVGLAFGDLKQLDTSGLIEGALLAALGACLAGRRPGSRFTALATCALALGAWRASAVGAGDTAFSAPAPVAGLMASLLEWLAGVRAAAEGGVHVYLPEPQASLAVGVLLGGPGHLDAAFRLDLQRSGLAHLVAIDGFKQVVVAGALSAVGVRVLGARGVALPIVLGVGAYTLLTGAHPSAVRAGLMVGLATLASVAGRVADPLTSLLLAVVAMAAVEPRILLDVGLQLSLSATLGIVLLSPRLRRPLRHLPRAIAEPVGLTLAVTLATLPVMLSRFQSVSLVSPAAHVLALPLLPAVLASTALLAVAAPVPPLGVAAAWLAWLPSTLLVTVIQVCGRLPAAAVSTGRLAPLASTCLAAALLAWGVYGLPETIAFRLALRQALKRRQALVGGWRVAAVCFSLTLAGCGVLTVARSDGRLHVDRLAVARGEAVFIRGPTGRTVLLVSGRVDDVALLDQLADRLDVWEHALDTAVQVDAPAEKGLALVLARYPAGRLIGPGEETRLDLGGGTALVVSAADSRVWVSYGMDRAWGPRGSADKPVFGESRSRPNF